MEGDDASRLPLVPGLTETAPDMEALPLKLMSMMAQRSGGSTMGVVDAIMSLRHAASVESNEKMKMKIEAALAMLTGDEFGEEGG